MKNLPAKVLLLALGVLISLQPTLRQPAAQSELDQKEQALDLIASFAERICQEIPIEGEGQKLELSGRAQVELNEILEKLADLGIEGAAKYESEEYKGVLQKDLAELLKNNMQCRLDVLKELKGNMFNENAKEETTSSINKKDYGSISIIGNRKDYFLGWIKGYTFGLSGYFVVHEEFYFAQGMHITIEAVPRSQALLRAPGITVEEYAYRATQSSDQHYSELEEFLNDNRGKLVHLDVEFLDLVGGWPHYSLPPPE